MDNEYIYYNKPTTKEPVMDEIEASLPMWGNRPPACKGSSCKSGRSEKQIKKDRKKKKMISGTHFWVSRKHLQRYVDCESFRYNTKHLSESERFDVFLQNTKRRLRYSQIN